MLSKYSICDRSKNKTKIWIKNSLDKRKLRRAQSLRLAPLSEFEYNIFWNKHKLRVVSLVKGIKKTKKKKHVAGKICLPYFLQ